MGHLVRKDQPHVRIASTKELLIGTCDIQGAKLSPGGTLDIEYGYGGTEINYDSQETATVGPHRVFYDQNGEEVTEDNVMVVDTVADAPDEEGA